MSRIKSEVGLHQAFQTGLKYFFLLFNATGGSWERLFLLFIRSLAIASSSFDWREVQGWWLAHLEKSNFNKKGPIESI